ncbi:MAG: Nramp family divalent metal transporter [Chloroflexi bacterium]|nr:Nramp family divalent metal transporter [Chloroflexota bacterium]
MAKTSKLGSWRSLFSRRRLLVVLGLLGPGMVAAIAGDDAGGIATYATVGAAYGYDLLWSMVVVTVLLGVVQEMVARLSIVSGKGLSDLIREQFGVRTSALAMTTLFIANGAVTISEFVGIAAGAELFGVSRYVAVPIAALSVWWLVLGGNYRQAEKVFLALSFVLVTYVVSAVVVGPDWAAVLHGTVVPTVQLNQGFILVLIATIGTTISPYMQFTLASTIVDKGVQPSEYRGEASETLLGVFLSDLFAFFIIVATAATLHQQGITQIDSASQAALALEPIAGPLAELLFGVGLLGASLLAASILPLSTAYSVCEAFGWERGVNRKWNQAPVFYGIYTALIVIGALVALIPGAPLFLIFVLVYDLNGILLPVLLVLMLRLANDRRLLGNRVNGPVANALGIATSATLIGLTVLLIAGPLLGLK